MFYFFNEIINLFFLLTTINNSSYIYMQLEFVAWLLEFEKDFMATKKNNGKRLRAI